jgi:hypothetical protein
MTEKMIIKVNGTLNSICPHHQIGYRYSPDISISTLKRTEETDRQRQHPYGSQSMAIRFLS